MVSDSTLRVRWSLMIAVSIWVAAGVGMATLRWDTSVEALMQQFDYDFQDNKLEENRAGLNKWLILGYSSLALMGVAGVVWTGGRTLKPDIAMLLPLALWGWCTVSLLWSVEPSLSLRRVAHLVMAVLGGLGITLFLRRREVGWSILLAMLYMVLAGLAAELFYGTFLPWRSFYRFSGVGHSNETALFCAVAILSARVLLLSLDGSAKASLFSERNILIGLMLLFVAFLILTKSRTTLLSLIVAMLLLQVAVSRSAGAWIMLTGLIASGSLFTIFLAAAPSSISSLFFGVAAVGRTSHVASLTGRLPLWEEILRDWEQRPIQGFGYGAYWTTKRVEDFAQQFHWEPPNGHSIYIDSLVETGPIGLTLMVTSLIGTFVIGLQYFRKSQDVAALFTVALVCLAVIHGIAESTFFKGCIGPLLFATSACFLWQNRVDTLTLRRAENASYASILSARLPGGADSRTNA